MITPDTFPAHPIGYFSAFERTALEAGRNFPVIGDRGGDIDRIILHRVTQRAFSEIFQKVCEIGMVDTIGCTGTGDINIGSSEPASFAFVDLAVPLNKFWNGRLNLGYDDADDVNFKDFSNVKIVQLIPELFDHQEAKTAEEDVLAALANEISSAKIQTSFEFYRNGPFVWQPVEQAAVTDPLALAELVRTYHRETMKLSPQTQVQ